VAAGDNAAVSPPPVRRLPHCRLAATGGAATPPPAILLACLAASNMRRTDHMLRMWRNNPRDYYGRPPPVAAA